MSVVGSCRARLRWMSKPMCVASKRPCLCFGFSQVSTYILAGLGDTEDEIGGARNQPVATLGVYPFVVPFVPESAATPLATLSPPSPEAIVRLLNRVASVYDVAGLHSQSIKAWMRALRACPNVAQS